MRIWPDGTPEIDEIVELVLDYNLSYLRHALETCGPVDLVAFGDDWGCQDRCIISPRTFRRYFKPGYAKMYDLCKQHGALTMQHSDGYTVDLWDEFLEAGLTAFNPQVNCMSMDLIEQRLKGKMCIIANVDRQHILPIGTPAQVREHIEELVTRLGSPNGGLDHHSRRVSRRAPRKHRGAARGVRGVQGLLGGTVRYLYATALLLPLLGAQTGGFAMPEIPMNAPNDVRHGQARGDRRRAGLDSGSIRRGENGLAGSRCVSRAGQPAV